MRKYFVFAIPALFLGMQLYRPERTNPPVQARLAAPPEVQALLDGACADCHSNRTVWPWYSHVAPVSWFVAGHVREGREHLNVDAWPGRGKPARLLEEMCEEVEKGAMPLAAYLRLHPEARLSDADKRLLCGWTEKARAEMPK